MFGKSKLEHELNNTKELLQGASAFRESIIKDVPYIEFEPTGIIRYANPLFLEVVGYQLDDLVGKHHSMLCLTSETTKPSYKQFWQNLAAGESFNGNVYRKAKTGREIWLAATYFPILKDGKVDYVVKVASDITEKQIIFNRRSAILDAMDRSLAIIDFTPDGTVITANQVFLDCLGYTLEEIVGKHHKLFCSDEFYEENPHFWKNLASGEVQHGLFQRYGKDHKEVWLEATYSPIRGYDNEVVKVIKVASDITDRVAKSMKVRDASQAANKIAENTVASALTGKNSIMSLVQSSKDINQSVQSVNDLIAELNKLSKSVESIVSTISSIADQTNLLALNAAIEAARAGEQGRGFAVVADEVRQLAARTSQSTSEVASVIGRNSKITGDIDEQIRQVFDKTLQGETQATQIQEVIDEIKHNAEEVSVIVKNLSL